MSAEKRQQHSDPRRSTARRAGRFDGPLAFLRARLSPTGYFGLHLTLGVLVLTVASALFGAIADDVVHGAALTIVDARVTTWLHTHAVPALTTAMLIITHAHALQSIGVMTLFFSGFLIWKREWYWLLGVALVVPAGMLLNVLMKVAFQRARPSLSDPILVLTTYSFPSGHTAAATCFYGVLAVFLCSRFRMRAERWGVIAIAALMIALVAASRVYLGVHYLSDVLAAIAEGVAWLAICLTAVHTLRLRARGRAPGP